MGSLTAGTRKRPECVDDEGGEAEQYRNDEERVPDSEFVMITPPQITVSSFMLTNYVDVMCAPHDSRPGDDGPAAG